VYNISVQCDAGAAFSKVPRKILGKLLTTTITTTTTTTTQFPITSLNRIDRSISTMFDSSAMSSG